MALLDMVVIVAVLHHPTVDVETQHRHTREGEFPTCLAPTAPPFDRRLVPRDDRLPEPAFDIFLDWKVLVQVAADAS